MNSENKIAHLNMIQQIITRMGNNSFSLKGWAVGIIIAIYAFAGQSSHKAVLITLIPIIIFWFLDAYYLLQEKLFRLLYDEVRTKDESKIDFSMNYNEIKINIGNLKKYNYFKILFSKTIVSFYTVCIAITLIIYLCNF